jgi:hypothetical protein
VSDDKLLERLRVRSSVHDFRIGQLESAQLRNAVTVQGPEGEQGPAGPEGPVGPMPIHEWDGTKLKFQQGPTGDTWGDSVDLQGPAGKRGAAGYNGLNAQGGGGVAVAAVEKTTSWYPGGW